MEVHLDGVDIKTIGPTGTFSDLAWTTRYGDGPCGVFEASWSMSLPADFDHPLLRRGTLVEIMDGGWRIGSPLILAEPARGTGYGNPWSLTATGLGSEATGGNSFYAIDGAGNISVTPSVAIDRAIADGLPWGGRDASIPTTPFGIVPDDFQTVGALLDTVSTSLSQRWGVGQDNLVRFLTDPTTPTYHVVPGVASLGVADDNYATRVLFRYINSTTHLAATAVAPASASPTELRYGRREYATTAPEEMGELSGAQGQAYANGVLANSKGRLGWTNGLTGLTSNDILTSGGVPADLSVLSEQVGSGVMVRLHGLFDDLVETTGATWLDLIIGEAKYPDGSQTIDLNPLGLAARDLASVVEAVTGITA